LNPKPSPNRGAALPLELKRSGGSKEITSFIIVGALFVYSSIFMLKTAKNASNKANYIAEKEKNLSRIKILLKPMPKFSILFSFLGFLKKIKFH
jgi:hypothetical protein